MRLRKSCETRAHTSDAGDLRAASCLGRPRGRPTHTGDSWNARGIGGCWPQPTRAFRPGRCRAISDGTECLIPALLVACPLIFCSCVICDFVTAAPCPMGAPAEEIPDALRFSEKVTSLSRFGSAPPEAPFWRGSEPQGGRTQSGSEEHVPLQSAYSEIGFRARALRLRHSASELPSGRCTMTDASGL